MPITLPANKIVQLTDPAIGVPAYVSVPANEKWLVQTIKATFTTGTETTDRMAAVYLKDNYSDDFTFAILSAPNTIQASTTITPVWGIGLTTTASTNSGRNASLPYAWLEPNMEVRVTMVNLEADDQVSGVSLYVAYYDLAMLENE